MIKRKLFRRFCYGSLSLSLSLCSLQTAHCGGVRKERKREGEREREVRIENYSKSSGSLSVKICG